jgi:hypothetical protein
MKKHHLSLEITLDPARARCLSFLSVARGRNSLGRERKRDTAAASSKRRRKRSSERRRGEKTFKGAPTTKIIITIPPSLFPHSSPALLLQSPLPVPCSARSSPRSRRAVCASRPCPRCPGGLRRVSLIKSGERRFFFFFFFVFDASPCSSFFWLVFDRTRASKTQSKPLH